MANVLYDKTMSYPAAGSLREALFLTVWLRRQGIAIEEARLMATGLGTKENIDLLIKSYDDMIAKRLPYLKGVKKVTDEKMMDALKKEVAVGRVPFQVMEDPHNNLLRKRAATLAAPDEYRAKLAAGVLKRRGLKR